MDQQRNELKALGFLVTATLLMMIVIVNYQTPVRVTITEETEYVYSESAPQLSLYYCDAFRESCFEMVSANTHAGYATYNIVQVRASADWKAEAETLKERLADYIHSQGYPKGLILNVLDSNDYERVVTVI